MLGIDGRGALKHLHDRFTPGDLKDLAAPQLAVGQGQINDLGVFGEFDIVQERLEREFNMDLITTAPTVVYQIVLKGGEVIEIA